MALIKFGLVVTEARGKLGGHVFTKTKAGAALRTGTTPTNPQSPAQQESRARIGYLSRLWGTLTRNQVDAWNAEAENYKRTNVFGDQFQYAGFNLFMQLNSNLLLVGSEPILLPPRYEEGRTQVLIASLNIPTAAGVATAITLTENHFGDLPAENFFIVTATAPKSQGVSNFSGMHRIVGIYSNMPTGAALLADYAAKFGQLSAGKRVEVGLYTIDGVTGLASVKQYRQADALSVGP